eukprot:CAMPEP_0174819978 /NCGR_PEP_ID=MMETSP1107-20130205/3510_1 /TAXON_ID=36770 /ORGANISM="Paraphysomonas vestita, Strain GFlagA" /LENGTH=618 /DNA_ID=CAMNT_0016034441 /DNA_START=429 /DNA_END=2285 /DNA_ORIENTATION=+
MRRSQLYGAAVRLAFHDAGEYDQNWVDELGSDGCLSNFTDNAGLIEPNGIVYTIIESFWQDVCDKISRADFWVLFAKIVIEEADPTHKISIPFHYGRIDATTCDMGAGRLPGAQFGIDVFQRVFVSQMGLTLHDAITLLGAHTLGHVHPQFSGYGRTTQLNNITTNSWDPTPAIFDNEYYKMLRRPWKSHFVENRTDITFWSVEFGREIMLNSDMSIGFPINLNPNQFGQIVGVVGEACLTTERFHSACSSSGVKSNVTLNGYNFIPTVTTGGGFGMIEVDDYSSNNDDFLGNFSISFTKMVTLGYDIRGISEVGLKLGMLELIDLTTCSNSIPPTSPPTTSGCPLIYSSYIGNGVCNRITNNADCQWDGGDCCMEDCFLNVNFSFWCGANGFNCLKPPPTESPTIAPTSPTLKPTRSPTTFKPTRAPTSTKPTLSPTFSPTLKPTLSPTLKPTLKPTLSPTVGSTTTTTATSTSTPTKVPTSSPTSKGTTTVPTKVPTSSPTSKGTTTKPTKVPTPSPTVKGTTTIPTKIPTLAPTVKGTTFSPTIATTFSPTLVPSVSSSTITKCPSSPRVGDSICDPEFNIPICSWDDGDCCVSSCKNSLICGSAGYNCLEPGEY